MSVSNLPTTQNPVGVPMVQLLADSLRNYVDGWGLKTSGTKPTWETVVIYIVDAMDNFIDTIDSQLMSGADKKASVLVALNQLYTTIVPNLLPLYLKPFSTEIENFMINDLCGVLIDIFVTKNQAATAPTTVPVPATPAT